MEKSNKRMAPGRAAAVHPGQLRICDLKAKKIKAGLQVNDDTETILDELLAIANASFELLQNHEEIPLTAKSAFWQLQKQFNIYSALLKP